MFFNGSNNERFSFRNPLLGNLEIRQFFLFRFYGLTKRNVCQRFGS